MMDNKDNATEEIINDIKEIDGKLGNGNKQERKPIKFTRLPKPKKHTLQSTLTNIPKEILHPDSNSNRDDESEVRHVAKKPRLDGPITSSLALSLPAPKANNVQGTTSVPKTVTADSKSTKLATSLRLTSTGIETNAENLDAVNELSSNKSTSPAEVSFFPLPSTTRPRKTTSSFSKSVAIDTSIYKVPETREHFVRTPDNGLAYYEENMTQNLIPQEQIIDIQDTRKDIQEQAEQRPKIIYDTSESEKITEKNGDYRPSSTQKYKHTLSSLIYEARTKHAALEERYAANRQARREAGNRYGF